MPEVVHFIGVGGVGMSALAHVLADKGIAVSGSDLMASYVLDKLEKKGVKISIGHSEGNIEGATRVVYSSDIAMSNPECVAALRKEIPLIHRSQLLAELIQAQDSLVVAGTHGKTSTASLLAHLLMEAGLYPSYAIGGIVLGAGLNGGGGTGPYFVAEADESDGSFLKYSPFGAIITNIDNDHLEYWKTEAHLLEGFANFAGQVTSKENLFWCKDDDALNSLRLPGYSYGFSEDADLVIDSYEQKGWSNLFDCTFLNKVYEDLEIPLIGAHNVLNAAAVLGAGLQIGISESVIRTAFKTFRGVARRAEKKGEIAGVTFYDDYAHHPTEISATLHGMKTAVGHRRLVAVFQPHRYTRVRDCFEQFPEVFADADALVVTDIFAARETPLEGVSIELLLEKIRNKTKITVEYAPRQSLEEFLFAFLREGDVVITLGAGDITCVAAGVMELYERSKKQA